MEENKKSRFTNEDGSHKSYSQFIKEVEKEGLDYVPQRASEKLFALVQELSNVYYAFSGNGFQESIEKFNHYYDDVFQEPPVIALLDFIKEGGFIENYNPKEELEYSFDFKSGLNDLINRFEELVGAGIFGIGLNIETLSESGKKYNEGYMAAMRGENIFVLPVVSLEYGGERRINYYLYELVHGALIAYHLPKLKEELEEKPNAITGPTETGITNIQKINWHGTPGEFATIFQTLIDKDFIRVPNTRKAFVKHLFNYFDIKNENGELITEDYLYKCFSERMKNYPTGTFKIPESDNYKQG